MGDRPPGVRYNLAMGLLQRDRGTNARADELSTLREVVHTYVTHRSPQIIGVGVAVVVLLRILAGGYHWADAVVVAATMVMTGLVEWVLHLFLLHAPEDSIRMTKYQTGAGHREHHLDPPNVGWLMLAPQDAALFLGMLAVWTAAWSLPIAWISGASLVGVYLSALLASFVTLAHYEWTHLLVHCRYRPKFRYYKRLAANHRMHHYRNEHHWLGVTSNMGDRMLGTLPASKSDVPLSDTARTLS